MSDTRGESHGNTSITAVSSNIEARRQSTFRRTNSFTNPPIAVNPVPSRTLDSQDVAEESTPAESSVEQHHSDDSQDQSSPTHDNNEKKSILNTTGFIINVLGLVVAVCIGIGGWLGMNYSNNYAAKSYALSLWDICDSHESIQDTPICKDALSKGLQRRAITLEGREQIVADLEEVMSYTHAAAYALIAVILILAASLLCHMIFWLCRTPQLPGKYTNLAPSSEHRSTTQAGVSMEEKRTEISHMRFTFANQIKNTLFNSWVNILLLAAPVGISLHFASMAPSAVFVTNLIAIVPLAILLSYAIEEIVLRVNKPLGDLVYATFGNATELIVSVIALIKDETVIVKYCLIGGILSNLLLVIGTCFFFGGLWHKTQYFNATTAKTAVSILALSVAGLITPLILSQSVIENYPTATISRCICVIYIFIYACYVFIQLPEDRVSEDEDEDEQPTLSLWVAFGLLIGSTVTIALCAEFMVDSISAITEGKHRTASTAFIGLIILPIVCNSAEHATAIKVAVKNQMDLTIGVAVGSSIQIPLFRLPLMVVLGWILGKDTMDLTFNGLQVTVVSLSVAFAYVLLSKGKAHYIEGSMAHGIYIMIALSVASLTS